MRLGNWVDVGVYVIPLLYSLADDVLEDVSFYLGLGIWAVGGPRLVGDGDADEVSTYL